MVAKLLDAHPGLSFRMQNGGPDELIPALERKEIDLYVGFPHPLIGKRFQLRGLTLPAPKVVVAPNHPLLKKTSRALADYLDYSIAQGPIAEWYSQWEAMTLADAGIEGSVSRQVLSTDNMSALISVLRNSEVVMAAMHEELAPWLETGQIKECPPPNWPTTVPGVIVTLKGNTAMPATERLVQHMLARYDPDLA